MTHYICTGGCKGVAEKPGICMTPDCPKHAEPLLPCDCTDGEHFGMQDELDREVEGEEEAE